MESNRDLPNLLLVDDDALFCRILSSALEKRGFAVQVANNVADAIELVGDAAPEYAVVDLSMPGDSGLVLVERLHQLDEHTRIVVLTGYASIATAVEAIKLGATHYLAKPADADEVVAALQKKSGDAAAEVAEQPMSTRRLEWEHIQKVLMECDGNISETARRLGMHRRTLQRKLAKRPSKT
ncbi:two-component system, response regulator RegA [Mariprofundus ferrinatatus]|uniref:Two-component system, response regulator RegA n=1 Tax=Mariprofundus ferrinatatus TaxID=1921087 RepID=A0A2K8L4W5_9PROT|nr:response regulator transcription factor [Mariprofundus ferrinatatus]ATX82360.1 two-component system, response regulator RegA [Mariprofundus ferrinatatus]